MTAPPPGRRRAGGPRSTGARVVAIGGGHGLAATLRALRRVTDDLTAVVAVSDDGGSSGRLRTEFDVVPPGDLRMALAALCGDDTWGRTWSRVVQHRFAGTGDLAGHSLGNLLITAMWEETGDIVTGLDWVGALLGAQGRVLPVATQPLQVVADVAGLHPDDPAVVERVVGQVEVATTRGEVVGLHIEPSDAAACPAAVEAIADAEAIVLGPGSWFTSVLAPLQVAGIGRAVTESTGRVVVVLNLAPQPGETSGFSPQRHLEVLGAQLPDLRVDTVLADPGEVRDVDALAAAATSLGGRLALAPVASRDGSARHDVDLLASALGGVLAP
ncbi:MAG TPA: uridine diphosphate-N-acetylglucosamine-binding protein YvcK [Candidatus Angelobacter sp.]|nr:uridine diphosphate-N-acetylglucosamine-binding protein YvcK [Candidatus Angelobacter sp.]